MYSYTNNKTTKNTFTCDITLDKKLVSEQKAKVQEQAAKEVAVPGFRKGHAPVNMAIQYLSDSKINETVLKNVLPKIYSELIAKENLKIVSDPHIVIKTANPNEDWTLNFSIALFPDVKLNNYKQAIAKLKTSVKPESKNEDEAKKAEAKTNESKEQKDSKPTLDQILEELLKVCELEVSDIIVNEEANSRLSRLYQDVIKTGVTFEKYLESKKTTEEELIKSTQKQAEDTYKIEFILGAIATDNSIEATAEDLEPIVKSLGTTSNAAQVERTLGFYKNFIKKQKVLDFLQTL